MSSQHYTAPPAQLTVLPVAGLPEVTAGADLAALITEAALAGPGLQDGDIVVITSKVVSKAEDRVVHGDRDSAIRSETVRVVARRGPTTISQTRHGLVMAAAGVDESNTEPGTLVLLPVDPDASAEALRKAIGERAGAQARRDHHRHDGQAVAGGPDRHGHRRGRSHPHARSSRAA